MSVEILDRASAMAFQFGGITPDIFELAWSKTKYTRSFLLSFSKLDVCKELPTGLQPDPELSLSLDRQLEHVCSYKSESSRRSEYVPSCTSESWWWRSGALSVNGSCNSKDTTPQFIKQDACSSWLESGARWNNQSLRLNRESTSRKNQGSDLRGQQGVLAVLPCPPKSRRYEAGILSQYIQETPKNDISWLCKSENPYRPPQCHKAGSSNFEAQKTVFIYDTHPTSQNETLPEVQTISSNEDHDVKMFSAPLSSSIAVDLVLAKDTSSGSFNVSTPSENCNSYEASVGHVDENREFDSYEDWVNINTGDSRGMHCGITPREHISNSSKVDNSCSPTVTETAISQHLAYMGSGMGHTGDLCASTTEGLSPTNSSESNSVDSEMMENKSNSELESSEVYYSRISNSGQIRSVDRIRRTDSTEPCQFPFLNAYDIITLISTDSYKKDANETSFEEVWSEIQAIIQFEQEMDLKSVPEYGQTVDSEAQICLPDDNTLISIAYPSNCELSEGNNSEDSADPADEIHLPDENNLITIDDLIGPNFLSLIADANSTENPTLWSSSTDQVAKQPEGLKIACDVNRSGIEDMTLSPLQDVKTSLSKHSCQRNPCNGIATKIPPPDPLDSQQAQMSFQMSSMNAMGHNPHSPLCTDMHQQAYHKEFDVLVQYSVLRQPPGFSQQYHELVMNVGPIDPPPNAQVAGHNWGLDRIQISSLAYQQATYPDLPLPDLENLVYYSFCSKKIGLFSL